jgi:hypothetical protein
MSEERLDDVNAWLRSHEERLTGIAEASGVASPLVRVMAAMVLFGLSDEEVYGQLVENLTSLNGQENPLEGADDALHRIRALTLSG